MKTLILTLLFGTTLLALNAQVASVDVSDLTPRDSSSKSIGITPGTAKTTLSIDQLSDTISQSLLKSNLLRDNDTEGALLLEVFVEENGTVHSSKISESDSPLMSKIVLELMESIGKLDLGDKKPSGISKVKIPVHYSL